MNSSRSRKILGIILENTAPSDDKRNHSMDYKQNDSNYEVQDENRYSLEENEKIMESVDYFEKISEAAIEVHDNIMNVDVEENLQMEGNRITDHENQIKGTQDTKSLVPDYDTDSTMSVNEDNNTKQYTDTMEECVYEESIQLNPQYEPRASSSKTSSSNSTSSSSSSSSCSDSDTIQPAQQTNDQSVSGYFVPETDSEDIIENTPPREGSHEARRSELNRSAKDSAKNNYYTMTSPIYTDESDIDLSDTDPTFSGTEVQKNVNYFFNEDSSSSSSSNSRRPSPARKIGRKRTKNPSQWKQNKMKRLRNSGKSYKSLSKTKKTIPARCLKEPCTDKCKLKCTTKINTNARYELFVKFWELGSLEKQRAYIAASMIDVQPRYKYTNAEKPRNANKAFHFIVNGTLIRVCKTFYKATLDITDRMIFTVQKKMKVNDFTHSDMRGRHQSHKKNDPELIASIKQHIDSIPKIESHYVRASTSKEYIDGSKTIKDLYNDFKDARLKDNKDAGIYLTYYKIFTTEFNLSFFKPKKDQCDLCSAYETSDAERKKIIEEEVKTHLEEKTYSREEKRQDRNRVNENLRVAVYDLEAVLQCPRGQSSSFYYRSKLNCYNLTVTELKPEESKVAYHTAHCYFWTESEAKRGSTEIGSCVWAYLNAVSEEGDTEKEVIFYSDNCCGQNKNKFIATLYLHAVQTLKIKSITHKFLVKGHTQNEADSVHSLIEKECKKNLRSGPIYTPDQYVAFIKSAKKTKPLLIVHEMDFSKFYDLKALQEEWGYNYSTNSEGQNVIWNNIRILKMTKDNPTVFFYKTSYKDEHYKEVNVRNKRKKMKPTTEITLQPAYFSKQELSIRKKKDLKELLSQGLIPSLYAGFYNSIL